MSHLFGIGAVKKPPKSYNHAQQSRIRHSFQLTVQPLLPLENSKSLEIFKKKMRPTSSFGKNRLWWKARCFIRIGGIFVLWKVSQKTIEEFFLHFTATLQDPEGWLVVWAKIHVCITKVRLTAWCKKLRLGPESICPS